MQLLPQPSWHHPHRPQTKLKFAHVYEINEPYHTEVLWAARGNQETHQRQVPGGGFPASQLGNETTINEGLALATIDMIYTGTSFAGSIHKPLAISGAPFVLRDFNHWKAYRDSELFRGLSPRATRTGPGNKVVALTYYGERMVTANKEIKKPEDMKGMKLRVPPAPLYLMPTKSVGPMRRRSRSPRSIWRFSRRPWTGRKIRCRPSWRRSSTRCRPTSCSPATSPSRC